MTGTLLAGVLLLGLAATSAAGSPDPAPVSGLSDAGRLDFTIGQAIFERLWVQAPSSTRAADGLGPLFNARSCATCHPGAGRGRPPASATPGDREGDQGVGYVMRLGNDPVYGRQLQNSAISGFAPEGRIEARYRIETVVLADGTPVTLHRPDHAITGLAHGPLADGTVVSPRIAPPVRGLGLLESVPEADILAAADPEDKDGDGISGRPNWLRPDAGAPMLGRFGWKAAHPTLDRQNAEAMLLDIGLSSPAFPDAWGDCTPAQQACRAARHGDSPQYEGLEVPSTMMALLDRYVRDLTPATPATPENDADGAGARLFHETGCAACHRPSFVTGADPGAPQRARRPVPAYTDLLLHDMGSELADGLAVGQASGQEWRTAPLWGLRPLADKDGSLALLHDGRARSILEAVLWHGGEGATAREKVKALPAVAREQLIRFVLSL